MGYPLKMLHMLLQHGIKPICIFDGRPHEGKVECEKKRAEDKEKAKEMAAKFKREGNEDEARKFSTRCIVVKTKQLDLFQEILDVIGIEHITAPYEADAQMAYMVKEGLADFAITEDSDLIAFGCPKVMLKLNWNGYGQVFDMPVFQKTDSAGKAWDNSLRVLQKLPRE